MLFNAEKLNLGLHSAAGWHISLVLTGCGSVWLERSVRDAEAGGSNPLIPTRFLKSSADFSRALFCCAVAYLTKLALKIIPSGV